MTAVELGADMCALARTSVRRGDVELIAAETLDPAAFPGIDAFTGAVRQARKTLKLPKHCRAVVWGLPDGANRGDPTVKPLIAPLVGAGFRVARVISPCNALAALARLKMPRGDGATCWLAINRTGVAMVVVRPGQQLYSHSFAWDSNVGSSGSQARLLQRYSLVAFLAPEIRRAMNAAREKGTAVDAIVTCGNLPEIRSLTMPLIEELDIEVESLDSLDGLIVKREATERLSEVAASLRIACAGAIARPTRRWDESRRSSYASRSIGRIAAAAIVILGVGLLGVSWWKMQPAAAPPPAKTVVAPPKAAPKQMPPPATNQPTTHAATNQPTPPAAAKQPALPAAMKQSGPSAATAQPSPAPPKQVPAIVTPKPDASAKVPVHTETPAQKPAPAPKQETPPATKQQPPSPVKQQQQPLASSDAHKPAESKPPAAAAPARVNAPLDTRPRPADKPDATPARTALAASDARIAESKSAEPLKDPVPRVTAILVSSDRRIATIDEGRIISVGEVLGKRVVVAIDERAVTLREPSGVQIRVGLGGRVLGIERSER